MPTSTGRPIRAGAGGARPAARGYHHQRQLLQEPARAVAATADDAAGSRGRAGRGARRATRGERAGGGAASAGGGADPRGAPARRGAAPRGRRDSAARGAADRLVRGAARRRARGAHEARAGPAGSGLASGARRAGHHAAAGRPELAERASSSLTDLTDGRYDQMDLTEDYEGTVLEGGIPKPVISGGEEDLTALVLRLAISQMIAERAGQPLSLLVLDEIFGSLDESPRAHVLGLLRRIAHRFPHGILLTPPQQLPEA